MIVFCMPDHPTSLLAVVKMVYLRVIMLFGIVGASLALTVLACIDVVVCLSVSAMSSRYPVDILLALLRTR
jgi:hypothetical protein